MEPVVRSLEIEKAFEPVRSSTKREREEDDLGSAKRTRRPYKRYPKPPYTYQAMALVAIETSPTKRLTLSGVQERLGEMFTFFQGEYKGWRDSVRHNLSNHRCFVRIPLNNSDNSKGCFWSVDLTAVTPAVFKRTTLRDIRERSQWAENIFLQLSIPEITLPSFTTEHQQSDQQSRNPHQTASVSTAGFTIDSILSRPTVSVEPPDAKYDHPFSFLDYRAPAPVTDASSTPYDATAYYKLDPHFPAVPQCPAPSYGESRPFSSIASEYQVYPEYSYPSAMDYQQYQPPYSWRGYYPDQTLSLPHASQHTGPFRIPDVIQPRLPSQTTHDQSSSKLYRPFDEAATTYPRAYPATYPTSYRCPSSTTAGVSTSHYDSDNSSDDFRPRPSNRVYIPPHYPSYSSDSSDSYMGPPSTPSIPSRPSPWGTYTSDKTTCKTTSTTSLVAAVDDLAMFSDDSRTSSQYPVIPIPDFSDDTQSSSSNMAATSGVHDVASLYGISRTDLIPHIDVVSVSSESSSESQDIFSNFGAMMSG